MKPWTPEEYRAIVDAYGRPPTWAPKHHHHPHLRRPEVDALDGLDRAAKALEGAEL